MNKSLETLRNRAIRLLTTPAEILYAIGRHWIMIAIFLAIGAMFLLAKATTEPVVYAARAKLAINPSKTLVISSEREPRQRRDELMRFLTTQRAALTSDAVLRRLVRRLGVSQVLSQEKNLEEKNYGTIRKFIVAGKRKVDEFMDYLEHPNLQDFGEENAIQRAIRSFRRRCTATVDPKTATISLRVLGNHRTLLYDELNAWIDAYMVHLEDTASESRSRFVERRIADWKQIASTRLKELEQFRKDNPGVDPARVSILEDQVARLMVRHEALQWRLVNYTPENPAVVEEALAPPPVPENPHYHSLLTQRRSLYAAVRKRRAEGFTAQSETIRLLNRQIELLDEEIASIEPTPPPLSPVKAKSVVIDRRPALEEQLARIGAEIDAKTRDRASLQQGLLALKKLQDKFREARDRYEAYENRRLELVDEVESKKNVQIHISDRPWVGTRPLNSYPYRKVLYGSFGAAGLGVLLAFFLEFINSKVRFKNDITGEFEIPVIGVLPKR